MLGCTRIGSFVLNKRKREKKSDFKFNVQKSRKSKKNQRICLTKPYQGGILIHVAETERQILKKHFKKKCKKVVDEQLNIWYYLEVVKTTAQHEIRPLKTKQSKTNQTCKEFRQVPKQQH